MVHLCCGQNARAEADFFLLKSSWIAVAVEPFMVLGNDGDRRAVGVDGPQDIGSFLRMAPDNGILVFSEDGKRVDAFYLWGCPR